MGTNAQTPHTFGHPNCYARELGNCSTQISREHYVSALVLHAVSQGDSSILVHNLSFQPADTLEEKGISNLVAKVLCDKHNSDLSPFDVAGHALFSGMDQIDAAAGKTGEKPETIVVNGDHLERWMLKTLCGGLYSGTIPLPGGSLKGIRPPKEWLYVLFRGDSLPAQQGLYLRAGTPGESFTTEPAVLKMKAKTDKDDVVIGFKMWVFNFEFTLVLAHLPPVLSPSLDGAHYRPKGLIVHGSNKRIQFEWSEKARSEEVNVAWLGPG